MPRRLLSRVKPSMHGWRVKIVDLRKECHRLLREEKCTTMIEHRSAQSSLSIAYRRRDKWVPGEHGCKVISRKIGVLRKAASLNAEQMFICSYLQSLFPKDPVCSHYEK